MDHAHKELLVARVCAGALRVSVPGRNGGTRSYWVRRPTREHAYVAAELYLDVFRRSELEGLYSEEELVWFLVENGMWDDAREKSMELLPKQIEESKVALYQATFKSNERTVIRKALDLATAEHAKLHAERHAYAHLSCSGAANIARARYLVGVGLHTASGRPVFTGNGFWKKSSHLLDEVMTAVAATRIDERTIRLLARTEPWRAIWNGARVERELFGVAPADWTEEQRALVNWSLLYDNVYQHPKCPPETVVEDDDLLDGWMIIQRREREQQLGEKGGEELVGNEKIRGSQEVYLVAETTSDARKVVDLNDAYGRSVQKQRFAHLAEKGSVNELEMPDTAMRLRTEVTQRLSQAMASRR